MTVVEPGQHSHAPLTGDYRPPTGVYDEMLGADGQVRPHWQTLAAALARHTAEELQVRQDMTRRVLREHGAACNAYSEAEGTGRPWTLDLIPLVIAPAEWRHLEASLAQRARLLNLILADFYGPQRLWADGLLPPALLFANPGFLRPCHGFSPPGGVHLCFHAVDLARSPDGVQWVGADRTQAPAGAGYALENRLVLTHVLPEEFLDCQARRPSPSAGRRHEPARAGLPNQRPFRARREPAARGRYRRLGATGAGACRLARAAARRRLASPRGRPRRRNRPRPPTLLQQVALELRTLSDALSHLHFTHAETRVS
jgi:hypothetical protein